MAIAGFHHVALTVTDLERSVAWYRSVLGFEVLFREGSDEGPGRRAAVLRFGEGGFAVGLVQHGDAGDDRFDEHRIGLDHVAFVVATREELVGWAAALDDAGVEHSEVLDVPVGAILNCKDPDGIALSLFWDG